jgi:hypothetical protein
MVAFKVYAKLKQALTSFGFASAVLSYISHCAFIIYRRQPPYLHDWIRLLAMLCLIVGTGVLCDVLDELYVLTAESRELLAAPGSVSIAITVKVKVDVTQCLVWSAILSTKLSILAMFRYSFEETAAWIRRCYYGAVIFTTICWMYLVLVPFVSCPHFGETARMCSGALLYR